LEEFKELKIVEGCKKAGATAKQAVEVAKATSIKVAKTAVVPAEKLSNMVVASLKRVNKVAAATFVKFRNGKLKRKK
jgi:transcriptional regulator NrdR family protein